MPCDVNRRISGQPSSAIEETETDAETGSHILSTESHLLHPLPPNSFKFSLHRAFCFFFVDSHWWKGLRSARPCFITTGDLVAAGRERLRRSAADPIEGAL